MGTKFKCILIRLAHVVKYEVEADSNSLLTDTHGLDYSDCREGVIHVTVKINAKFVRQMLIELEMDQQDLARKSGISEQTITRLLQGKPFTSDTLGKLAKALRCHPVDLIEGSGYPSPHVDAPATRNGRAQVIA
jgi:DNA-binding Xre family transcriptional regulator